MRLKKITSGWFACLDEVYRHFVPRLISAGMLQGSLNDYFDDKGFFDADELRGFCVYSTVDPGSGSSHPGCCH
jgi:hypothetical protein